MAIKKSKTKKLPVSSGLGNDTPARLFSVKIEFQNSGANRVLVAGSFNGWVPEKTPLSSDGQGRWTGSLSLPPGRHEYLLVVDGQWIADPSAKETVGNPFGGLNSVLSVAA